MLKFDFFGKVELLAGCIEARLFPQSRAFCWGEVLYGAGATFWITKARSDTKAAQREGLAACGARFGFACFVLRAFVVQAFGGRGVVRSRSSTLPPSAKSNF